MGLKGGDSNPLICGRLQLSSSSRIYMTSTGSSWEKHVGYSGPVGNWSAVYLKGCGWDGRYITFPTAGKYAFTCRMGIKEGAFTSVAFWLDVLQGQDWWCIANKLRHPNVGSCFIDWRGIANLEAGAIVSMRLTMHDYNTHCGYWIIPEIDLPRAPILEWFRISPSIGERSAPNWYWQ